MTGREIREFSGSGQGRFKGEKSLFENWQEYRFFHLENGKKTLDWLVGINRFVSQKHF